MLSIKEQWTGILTLDEGRGLLRGGRLVIHLGQIEDVALCEGAVRFGKKDADKGAVSPLLCLRLREPVQQPGRWAGLLKGRNLVLRPCIMEEARCLVAQLPAGQSGPPERAGTFPVDLCIVQAKRGCCDYIRGGTSGAHPYGKAGLVSPMILPEVDLTRGGVTIRYLGTNSRLHESEWFSAHPGDFFSFAGADDVVYTLSLRERGCTVSALYRCTNIEQDEHAIGLWYVEMEASFDTVCAGGRWLEALQAAAGQSIGAPEHTERAGREAPAYDRAMLLAAVDLLHAAGVLDAAEWQEKRERVEHGIQL